MTNDAMNGKIPVEAVFGRRLDIIRPSRGDLATVGRQYVAAVEPTAAATVTTLRARGWTPAIISAGFTDAIRPLAAHLGIERVCAVDLQFAGDGAYAGFDRDFPATRSGGKPEVVRRLKRELSPERVVAVGDGVSDLETKPEVNLFVGFGRYVARERVRREADRFILSLEELLSLI